jgi:23S rRNA pseudouridine2605 synthase
MRLQSYLSQAGISSRRSVVDALKEGKVKVNGEVVRIPSYPIFPGKDSVFFEAVEVKLQNKKRVYFLFHKPAEIVTTVQDTHGRKTVLDFFKDVSERLYPVGRLDKDTTGLILLTNDGELTNRLTHPRYGVEKIYEVSLDKKIGSSETAQLERGVVIEGTKTANCTIKILGEEKQGDRVEVVLHEGRKRQIRQMFELVGFKVVALHRKKYGPITLDNLKAGDRRPLNDSEVQALRDIAFSRSGTGPREGRSSRPWFRKSGPQNRNRNRNRRPRHRQGSAGPRSSGLRGSGPRDPSQRSSGPRSSSPRNSDLRNPEQRSPEQKH